MAAPPVSIFPGLTRTVRRRPFSVPRRTYGGLRDLLCGEVGCVIRVKQCCVAQVVRAVERGVQRGEIQNGHRIAVQTVRLFLNRVHQVGALAQGYGILQTPVVSVSGERSVLLLMCDQLRCTRPSTHKGTQARSGTLRQTWHFVQSCMAPVSPLAPHMVCKHIELLTRMQSRMW